MFIYNRDSVDATTKKTVKQPRKTALVDSSRATIATTAA
jgi:hypothetical protein